MGYAELSLKTWYSFLDGASSPQQLLERAQQLGYHHLAITDSNLCGAMEFARIARELGIHPVIGSELTLSDDSRITLLAATKKGYSNLCNLITQAYTIDRKNPTLDPQYLPARSEELILLTGGLSHGRLPRLLTEDRRVEAEAQLKQYCDWFGCQNVYVELQQRLKHGDVRLNQRLRDLALQVGVEVVASTGVLYHAKERHRLQDVLVAIRNRKSLYEVSHLLQHNAERYLKSQEEMGVLFQSVPEALANTLRIAERCTFDLTKNSGYRFPRYPVPEDYTELSYLKRICYQSLDYRYGSGPRGMRERALARLEDEFKRIAQYDLAGYFLWLHEIVLMAWQIDVDFGRRDPEVSWMERSPVHTRGSSVVLLLGYLIGLGDIDPIKYDLSLDRFLPGDVPELISVPDVDFDFGDERDELLKRMFERWGRDHVAMAGTYVTYQSRGAIRDVGKALGLPAAEIDQLAKWVRSDSADNLALEMAAHPQFRDKYDAPVWREFTELVPQLIDVPRYLSQHCGGIILSSTPISDFIPVQPCAIAGRSQVQGDKRYLEEAQIAKIDILGFGAITQAHQALRMIEQRTTYYPDLTRINFADRAVFDMFCKADTIGVTLSDSGAQMANLLRFLPTELLHVIQGIACVRPGVGATEGSNEFVKRHNGKPWRYTHPLEARALHHTYGVILYQDQQVILLEDVFGLSPSEADQFRRALGQPGNERVIASFIEKCQRGAAERGVTTEEAIEILGKISPHYMFPQGHAVSFGTLSYQMAWLKYYYPREFYCAWHNSQPMGFHDKETVKEDARHHNIATLHPDINLSMQECTIHNESILLGLSMVKDVGSEAARGIVEARERGGPFHSLADAMERTKLKQVAVENLVRAGAFDNMVPDRKSALWEVGIRYRAASDQLSLKMPVDYDMARLTPFSEWENMLGEYSVLEMYPRGHIMQMFRPSLGKQVTTSTALMGMRDEAPVIVAGRVVRCQQPVPEAIYMLLEDEFGLSPILIWPWVYQQLRPVLEGTLLVIAGQISRRDGIMNITLQQTMKLKNVPQIPRGKKWS